MLSDAKAPAQELPKNDPKTETALISTLAVSSVGIATLNMLETLLLAAAEEVERESQVLSRHFTTLTDYINGHERPPERVRETISRIIMGMQLPDRNTQIMENAASILERYRSMLETISRTIEAVHDGNPDTSEGIAEAMKEILSGIRLSDIRARYLEALSTAKIAYVDTPASKSPATPPDDIDFF